MPLGYKAPADEAARRINAAAELLASGMGVPEVTRDLARRYRLSERQAHRYVDRAVEHGAVEVPVAKVVFTVKLPRDLTERLRGYARVSGRTLSSLVAEAIQDFLDRGRAGPRGGRAAR
jgi:DNA-binding transcriptional regulator LsrR (DeoR family)